MNRCDLAVAGMLGMLGVVGPTLEAYETELGLAGSTGHMTTSFLQVDEQATFRTSPDAGTARYVIDLFLHCSIQNTKSRVLSIASFVPTTRQAPGSPPALAGPAEVERFT